MKFMTLWTDDWIAGTHPLSPEERGVYITLVCHFVNKDRVVPDNDVYLARLSNISTRAYRRIKNTLIEGCFMVVRDSHIWIERTALQYKKDQTFSKNQAEKAKLKARYNKGNALNNKEPVSAPAVPTLPLPLPLPLPHKEEIHKEPDISKEAFDLWNVLAKECGLPVARAIGDRKSKINLRLHECGGIDGWSEALGKIRKSPYLRGDVNGFRASLDFLLQKSSFVKVIEGNYDDTTKQTGTRL